MFICLCFICLYIGHSFRRSSASQIANEGASENDILSHGQWRSTKAARRYIEDSDRHLDKMATYLGGNDHVPVMPEPDSNQRPRYSYDVSKFNNDVVDKKDNENDVNNNGEINLSQDNDIVIDLGNKSQQEKPVINNGGIRLLDELIELGEKRNEVINNNSNDILIDENISEKRNYIINNKSNENDILIDQSICERRTDIMNNKSNENGILIVLGEKRHEVINNDDEKSNFDVNVIDKVGCMGDNIYRPIDLTHEEESDSQNVPVPWIRKEQLLDAEQRRTEMEVDKNGELSDDISSEDVSICMDDSSHEPHGSNDINGELDLSDDELHLSGERQRRKGAVIYHGKVTNFVIKKNCGGKHIYNF